MKKDYQEQRLAEIDAEIEDLKRKKASIEKEGLTQKLESLENGIDRLSVTKRELEKKQQPIIKKFIETDIAYKISEDPKKLVTFRKILWVNLREDLINDKEKAKEELASIKKQLEPIENQLTHVNLKLVELKFIRDIVKKQIKDMERQQ